MLVLPALGPSEQRSVNTTTDVYGNILTVVMTLSKDVPKPGDLWETYSRSMMYYLNGRETSAEDIRAHLSHKRWTTGSRPC